MQLPASSEKSDKTRSVDESILNLFYKLSSNISKIRVEACSAILRILLKKQSEANEPTKDLQYCIERLIKGLASSRDSARLGFSLLLTEILKQFDIIEIENILELVKKHLTVSSAVEKKDAIFGQLFAYSSIVRCGKLANHSHLSFVVTALYDLWEGKNYILRASYEILMSLFSQLSEEKFIETLWPLFKNKLTFGWEKSSADSIWPLFLCMRLFPDAVTAKFLKKHWNEDIFHYENFDHLKKSLRQTTSCLPTLHPLCAEILHFCMARKDGKDIWNALVDDNLFEIDQTRKAYVGFEMVKKVLQETQKKKTIKFVLSPKFCTMFTKSLLSRKHPMNPAAVQLAGFLSNIVKQSKDPDIQMIILKVFLQSSAPFDQMIRLKDVSAIIQNLQPDAVKAYWELLKTFALIKSESDEEEEIGAHSKCFQSVLQIGSLVNHPTVVFGH
ncbi:DNA polymerase V [Caerostris darwini]|uniref:DNA polymerase V n=1 Tax=Caerostris darwini TaxID=1538125 RepID=A0AAV4MWL7_9ARAC|nr:DNA polymerase V [Caerostris darwini]